MFANWGKQHQQCMKWLFGPKLGHLSSKEDEMVIWSQSWVNVISSGKTSQVGVDNIISSGKSSQFGVDIIDGKGNG